MSEFSVLRLAIAAGIFLSLHAVLVTVGALAAGTAGGGGAGEGGVGGLTASSRFHMSMTSTGQQSRPGRARLPFVGFGAPVPGNTAVWHPSPSVV